MLLIPQLKSYRDFKVFPKPFIHPSFQWLREEGSTLALTPLSLLAHVLLMTGIAEVETLLWAAQEEIVYVSLWLLPLDTVLTRWWLP